MGTAGFVALCIFPFVEVRTQSGPWPVPGREKFQRHRTARQPGEEACELGPPSQRIVFCCDKPWPDGEATDESWLMYESEVQKLVAGGRVPNVTLAGTSQWSNHLNSDPIGAVDAQKLNIRRSVGKIPNTLVVSHPVFLMLRQHPKTLFGVTNTGILGQEDLKKMFGVENLLVARSDIWKNDALLCYVPPQPGLGAIALGYTFRWQSYYGVQLIKPQAGFYWVNATA